MKDSPSFRIILQNDNEKVYVDFNKGYDYIFNALHRLGYDFPHTVQFSHLKFKFTHQGSENLKYMTQIIDKDDYIMEVFRAYQYIIHEEGFDEHLNILIKSNRIKSINDILTFGNLHQVINWLKNQDIPEPSKQNIEDINFEEMTIFNKPVLFTPYRISSCDLPKGIYKYECQHDDEQNGVITMIGKCIHVNFIGTILSSKKIALYQGYRNVNETKDIIFHDTKDIKLADYLKKHHIMKNNHTR